LGSFIEANSTSTLNALGCCGSLLRVVVADSCRSADNQAVIKVLKDTSQNARDDLVREACMLARLKPHASICTFYGAVLGPESWCLVTELIAGGNLLTLLRDSSDTRPVTGFDQVNLARDLAAGMSVLHASGVLHLEYVPRLRFLRVQ
jgi:serine/threonine protein kinase